MFYKFVACSDNFFVGILLLMLLLEAPLEFWMFCVDYLTLEDSTFLLG